MGDTVEGISHLKLAFKKDGGAVTAAISLGIDDTASTIIVMSGDKAKEICIKPMANWIVRELAGVEPGIMGISPVVATWKVIKKRLYH